MSIERYYTVHLPPECRALAPDGVPVRLPESPSPIPLIVPLWVNESQGTVATTKPTARRAMRALFAPPGTVSHNVPGNITYYYLFDTKRKGVLLDPASAPLLYDHATDARTLADPDKVTAISALARGYLDGSALPADPALSLQLLEETIRLRTPEKNYQQAYQYFFGKESQCLTRQGALLAMVEAARQRNQRAIDFLRSWFERETGLSESPTPITLLYYHSIAHGSSLTAAHVLFESILLGRHGLTRNPHLAFTLLPRELAGEPKPAQTLALYHFLKTREDPPSTFDSDQDAIRQILEHQDVPHADTFLTTIYSHLTGIRPPIARDTFLNYLAGHSKEQTLLELARHLIRRNQNIPDAHRILIELAEAGNEAAQLQLAQLATPPFFQEPLTYDQILPYLTTWKRDGMPAALFNLGHDLAEGEVPEHKIIGQGILANLMRQRDARAKEYLLEHILHNVLDWIVDTLPDGLVLTYITKLYAGNRPGATLALTRHLLKQRTPNAKNKGEELLEDLASRELDNYTPAKLALVKHLLKKQNRDATSRAIKMLITDDALQENGEALVLLAKHYQSLESSFYRSQIELLYERAAELENEEAAAVMDQRHAAKRLRYGMR